MAGRTEFFGAIGKLDNFLGSLEEDLAGWTLKTRRAKAAQIHVRSSREWIKSAFLENPAFAEMVKDQNAIKSLESAVIELEQYKPRTEENLAVTCDAIDKALGSAHAVIREIGDQKGIIVGELSTYDKALSFLPGDPDFPTDTDEDSGQKPSGRK